MQSTQIMAMYGTDGFDMVQRLLEQMDAVSHLPQDKHASIAIKPNLVVAHTADTGPPPIQRSLKASSAICKRRVMIIFPS